MPDAKPPTSAWRRAAGVVAAIESVGALFLAYELVTLFGTAMPIPAIACGIGSIAAAAILCATAVTLLRRRDPGRAGRAWILSAWAVHLAILILFAALLLDAGGWSGVLELAVPVLVLWAVLALGTVRLLGTRRPVAATPAAPPAGK